MIFYFIMEEIKSLLAFHIKVTPHAALWGQDKWTHAQWGATAITIRSDPNYPSTWVAGSECDWPGQWHCP